MKRLKSFIAAIVADSRELAIPLAPEYYVLAPGQAATLEQHGIQKIHLVYRKETGLVPYVHWAGGEKAAFVQPLGANLPPEPFLVIRRNFGDFEIRAGLEYLDMSVEDVQALIGNLLEGAVESVLHVGRLNALQRTKEQNKGQLDSLAEAA